MGMQGTVDDWRKDLLRDLESICDSDFLKITHVIWLTARDTNVCPLCAAREGKRFTIAEVKKILQGHFCKPEDEDDRCRCCFTVDDFCYE